MAKSPLAGVIGALNLDLVITGLPKFADPGEQVNGRSVTLSPGGKGRNIAVMLAAWLAPGQVSMVSKLVQDPFELYRIPFDSLVKAQIDTRYVTLDSESPGDLPTLAVFLNTTDHQRANYYLPGRNETLSAAALDTARPLFQKLAENDGFLLLSLEMPLTTACHALTIAASLGLRVMLDPGGQPPGENIDFSPLFDQPIFLLKPNALEAARLTGHPVYNFTSAREAAAALLGKGVRHVLITHGEHGAYAFSGDQGWHIPAPNLPIPKHAESTGCGDQVLSVLCAQMLHGKTFKEACRKAIIAGSLQFLQPGLTPIQPDNPYLHQ